MDIDAEKMRHWSIVSPQLFSKPATMDRAPARTRDPVHGSFSPVESLAGRLDGGVLVVCDHASNAIPPGYALGLPLEAFERHIAYDIGAAAVTRALAALLRAPALLSTYSRLLIDPNRGADDPTLVMRYSDCAIIPGNARADEAEVQRRRELFWAPYRDAIEGTVEAMLATGEPPAIVSIHTFTPVWRGSPRRWKVGVLWDCDARLPGPLLDALAAESDLGTHAIGDNEPYDGALIGDTIDAIATSRGLSNALIEIRQDLVADAKGVTAWAERFARLLKPLVADRNARTQRDFGSRAGRGRASDPLRFGRRPEIRVERLKP
jgi:predicted N-formylglutamate amidohydrolase